MSELTDLYQEVILDHNKNPRHFRRIDQPTHQAEGDNPLCGDKVTVFLTVKDDVVADISFIGSGCAISKASASLMVEALKGKTIAEAEALFTDVRNMLTSGEIAADALDQIGKLAALSGVSQFPMRIKCATLSWHAMRTALKGGAKNVTTE